MVKSTEVTFSLLMCFAISLNIAYNGTQYEDIYYILKGQYI